MGKGRNATLGEVLGKKGEVAHSRGVELSDLPDLLGEGMPKLEFHALGRVRLKRALEQRFGQNYRSIPGVQDIMAKFEHEVIREAHYHKIRMKFGRR